MVGVPFRATRTVHEDWSAHHAPTAAGGMNAECVLLGPDIPGAYDAATMTTAGTRGPARWAGPCRVQASASQAAVGDQAGQEVTVHDYLVQFDDRPTNPVPADVAQGWQVRVTACPNDATLVGRPLDVADVARGSERFTRDLFCDANEG